MSAHSSSKPAASENAKKSLRPVIWIAGTIESARGLPTTWRRKCLPYVVMKLKKANGRYTHIFTSEVRTGKQPVWNENFAFTCPPYWVDDQEITKLRVDVFNAASNKGKTSDMGSDHFLGGCELDLRHLLSGRTYDHELELEAGTKSATRQKDHRVAARRRGRFVFRLVVERMVATKHPEFKIKEHMLSIVEGVNCYILNAENLRNADFLGKSDPQCVVSVLLMSGVVNEIYRTHCLQDTLHPVWMRGFHQKFHTFQEPIALLFDIWDKDDDTTDITQGDHLGTACYPLCLATETMEPVVLPLLPSSQLFLGRLGRDGRPSGNYASGLSAPDVKAMNLAHRLKRLVFGCEVFGDPVLMIKVSVTRTQRAMPHAELLEAPMKLQRHDDIEKVLANPSWQYPLFDPPQELQDLLAEPDAKTNCELRAKERIVFVHGVAFGASQLPAMDQFSKSDPYCIIEFVGTAGERFFVHRTRCIEDDCNPCWNEFFFYKVPSGIEMKGLSFMIWDRDAGDGENDDFLGGVFINVTALPQDSCIDEEYALQQDYNPRVAAMESTTRQSLSSVISPASTESCAAVPETLRASRTHETLLSTFSPASGALKMSRSSSKMSIISTLSSDSALKAVLAGRLPTLSVRIRAERRVMPALEQTHVVHEAIATRHNLSRTPPTGTRYQDPSLTPVFGFAKAAAKVTEFKSGLNVRLRQDGGGLHPLQRKLKERAQLDSWLEVPALRPATSSSRGSMDTTSNEKEGSSASTASARVHDELHDLSEIGRYPGIPKVDRFSCMQHHHVPEPWRRRFGSDTLRSLAWEAPGDESPGWPVQTMRLKPPVDVLLHRRCAEAA